MQSSDKAIDADKMREIRHDVKNQLSNINLLLAQLKYELQNSTADCIDYLDMIALSTTKIDTILNSIE